MSLPPLRILALSGSLRKASSNTALVDALALLAPQHIYIDRFTSIADLPHFSPDLECTTPLPSVVRDLRSRVTQADGLIISCPEYARGVPGSFKNALDWLVGSASDDKAIALWNTAPRAHHAQDSLRLILSTMLGRIIEPACINIALSGNTLTAAQIAKDSELSAHIVSTLSVLVGILSE